MATLLDRLPSLPGTDVGTLRVAGADSFTYTDPTNNETSANQGIRVLFEGGSRVVFRLSGTGTAGATLRVYLERYERDEIDGDTTRMLATIAAAADEIAGIARFTGRNAPDVVT
jgi:phosphoglucomutase